MPGPMPGPLVTEMDFAAHILSRHPGVVTIDFRDCDPEPGHCTLIITGGDPAAVLADSQPLTICDLHIRRDCG